MPDAPSVPSGVPSAPGVWLLKAPKDAETLEILRYRHTGLGGPVTCNGMLSEAIDALPQFALSMEDSRAEVR
jgi:hypothetical protein